MKRALISIMIVLTVAFAAIAGDNPRVDADSGEVGHSVRGKSAACSG
jgi:hypothetical protein